MKYRDEKFYWTYQRGVSWPDDYINQDSMTHWIIEKSQGLLMWGGGGGGGHCLELQKA